MMSPNSARIVWIDVSKGVAICLVVLGHCWIGLHSAGLIPDEGLFAIVRDGIYLFHMPLFFVISGLLAQGLASQPFSRFATSRVLLLLWPLVLWTYLMNAGKLAMGNLANDPVTWDSFTWSPLPPQWQFWFLWALFLHQLLFWGLSGSARMMGIALTHWHWVLVIGGMVALDTFGGTFGAVDPFLRSALLFAPFFYLGVMLSLLPPLPVINPLWPVAGFLMAQAIYHLLLPPLPMVMLLAMLAALSVMLLCRWGAEQTRLTLLSYLGTTSMAIYLAHTFFSAPVRAVLNKLDITSLPLHVLLGTALGIIGPLILLQIAKRSGTRRILGF